jgi:hypothetical protein
MREDDMAAFFGKVAMGASLVILIYQILIANRLSARFGVDQNVFILPILMAMAWGLVYFHPSLASFALAEGAIFYFADFAAVALLHPVLSVYPYMERGAVKVFTEGFRPACRHRCFSCLAGAVSFHFSIQRMSFYMFVATLGFVFPSFSPRISQAFVGLS